MDSADNSAPGPSRGRGRGKSRGGLGKYLRARGRGRGKGRPAEFHKRLVLEDEEHKELDEEEQKELALKYSRRQLGTNADRYVESDPELDSEGEPIVEPEVDLSSFLERQRLSDAPLVTASIPEDEDDIDHSLAHLAAGTKNTESSKKGKVHEISWDASLEEMSREKAAAEATRDLKARFKAKVEKERSSSGSRVISRSAKAKGEKEYVQAPALPTETPAPSKSEKDNMEDFLDDLLG
ncbi:hypothetical protein BDY19DRAFT_892967 [Irpex rosettiformis]|uniref:Uncharacterized protein n=1 Tax=Irpex rosettiformis TaxID=378272 RepID=A0ACB8TZP8_9APHY|nr:hypothetical protein BDY19DRAFT_892967 [Irpex rosettiformis]